MKKCLIACAVALSFACSDGGGVTSPSRDNATSGGSQPTAASVSPTPTATPSAGTPTGDRPYVEFYPPAGDGKFCNPMTHSLTLTVEYWNANVFAKQIPYEKATLRLTAQPNTCVTIPPVSERVKLDCGEKVNVQVDASTTEHLGHIFVDLVGPEEKETVTEEVAYSEWSECRQAANADSMEQCSRSRTKTVTITKKYVCKEPVIEVKTSQESEPCKCPCVEQWSGSFTVKADTHESGEYAYRVCTKQMKNYKGQDTGQCNPGHVVWQGWILKGSTFTKDYPVNGDTLYVQVNLDRRDNGEENPDSDWERIGESAKASCGDLKATWNEDIVFNCKQVCGDR